jgi:hypothetical protein
MAQSVDNEAYLARLQAARADRLFKAEDLRTGPAERLELYADARGIEREIGILVTRGSTYVRTP